MVNTEGSRNLSQELLIRKYIVRVLTPRQMAILYGSLLGDGYIHTRGKMCFEQSDAQIDYLYWKYAELQNFVYPKIAQVRRFDKRSGRYTTSHRFFLRQYFQKWRQVWYPQGIKSIPDDLSKWFTPLSLAVWYMDDGHLNNGKSPLFASENFCSNDLAKIIAILQKWDLNCSLSHNNRLRILHNSTSHFMELIKPHILESLRYKILDPVTT